jgi:hypothetical protein
MVAKYMFRGELLPLIVIGSVMMCGTAQGSLVFEGSVASGGAGIGASNVVLTIQNTTTERGCVAWNGTVDIVGATACPAGFVSSGTTYDEKVGNSQVQTQTVTTLGITDPAYLHVIFNPVEPSGDAIQLENLVLTIYSPTGTALISTSNFSAPVFLAASDVGQGSLGFGFVLTPSDVLSLSPYLTCPTCGSNRIGLAAWATNSQGGNETFSVIQLTPEPVTWLTFMGGLATIGLIRRSRRATAGTK